MRPTEQTRTELLAVLSRLGQLRPEWRLGQTLANLAMTAGRLDSGGVWDLEDEEALAAARTLIRQYSDIGCGEDEPTDGPERRVRSSVMVR
jgi:hypothetical protein